MKKINDIEVLRGFAILFVLFYHLNSAMMYHVEAYWQVYHYFTFWSGVDLFFAISGFVITNDLLQRSNGQLTPLLFSSIVKRFWLRRVWRLYPAAWTSLLLMLFLTLTINWPPSLLGDFNANFGTAIATVAQVANLYGYECAHQMAQSKCGAIGLYWSLSLEEQFYMVLPFLLLLPYRWLVPLLGLTFFAQFFTPRNLGDFGWFFRTDALILGVLLGLARSKNLLANFEPRFLKKNHFRIIQTLFLLMLIAAIPTDLSRPKLSIISIGTGVLAVLCGLCVFIAQFDKGYIWPEGRIKNLLMFIGSRSYSLYLFYPLSYILVRQMGSFAFPPEMIQDPKIQLVASCLSGLSGIFLVFLLAELCLRCIEQPLRKKGRAIADGLETAV